MSNPWFSGNPAVNAAIEDYSVALAGETVNSDAATSLLLPAGLAGELLFANNAAAQSLTLPQDSDADYAIGAHVTLIQLGAGLVTVSAGTGATLHDLHTGKTLGQWSRVTLTKIAANTWLASGDLAAS